MEQEIVHDSQTEAYRIGNCISPLIVFEITFLLSSCFLCLVGNY